MNKSNRVPAYLDDEEKQQLVSRAQSMSVSQSEVVRRALLEYLDRDRAERIEAKVDRIEEQLDALSDPTPTDAADTTTHTHTASSGTGGTSKTVQRARSIAQRIYDNHDPVVKDVNVKRAIEDVAGGDPRTMRKYKGMLRERGLLYEHPSESAVWTSESDRWAKWSTSYVDSVPSAELRDICDDYPHKSDAELFDDCTAAEATGTQEDTV